LSECIGLNTLFTICTMMMNEEEYLYYRQYEHDEGILYTMRSGRE